MKDTANDGDGQQSIRRSKIQGSDSVPVEFSRFREKYSRDVTSRGVAYLVSCEFDKAIVDLESAANCDSKSAMLPYLLGIAYRGAADRMGEYAADGLDDEKFNSEKIDFDALGPFIDAKRESEKLEKKSKECMKRASDLGYFGYSQY